MRPCRHVAIYPPQIPTNNRRRVDVVKNSWPMRKSAEDDIQRNSRRQSENQAEERDMESRIPARKGRIARTEESTDRE
jgi:hypothetical protein